MFNVIEVRFSAAGLQSAREQCRFQYQNIPVDVNLLKACGPPNYSSLEAIGGKLHSTPGVDIWSDGMIYFLLLCGKLPSDDEYIPNLFKKHCRLSLALLIPS